MVPATGLLLLVVRTPLLLVVILLLPRPLQSRLVVVVAGVARETPPRMRVARTRTLSSRCVRRLFRGW